MNVDATAVVVEIIKQAPALGVLSFVVWSFLQRMKMRDELLMRVYDDYKDLQVRSVTAITENSRLLGEMSAWFETIDWGKIRRD